VWVRVTVSLRVYRRFYDFLEQLCSAVTIEPK